MTTPPAVAPARPLVWLFGALLLATLWFTTRGWHDSLLDRHEFRQTQTAISAYWMKEAGAKVAYETPLFGPPWSIPLEFPIYQWIVAKVSSVLGTGLETTGRGVSLAFFFAALPAVYGFCGLFPLARSRRLLVVSVLLASPTYLFWSRTFMIETTALSLSTWFLFTLALAVRHDSRRYTLAATLLGTLAALAKVTTFLVFCPPAVAVLFWFWRQRRKTTPETPHASLHTLILWGVPMLVTAVSSIAWLRYADAIKRTNPFSTSLTSAHLSHFTWGTLQQRLTAAFWIEMWNNLSTFVLGGAAMGVLLVGFILATPAIRRVALCGVGFYVAGFLLFSNLYYSHDYYYCANALFLLMGAGVLLVAVWDQPRLPLPVRAVLLLVFFVSQLAVYSRQFGHYASDVLPRPPVIADVIRAQVPKQGVLLIYGWDWNSLVPYYAERRAVMVPLNRDDDVAALESIVAQLPPRHIAALLVRNDSPTHYTETFIRERIQRFDLAATPAATSPEGDLYLPRGNNATASATPLLTSRLPPAYYDPVLKMVEPSSLNLPLFTPHPSQGRTQFGMGAAKIEERPVLNAHAPSELYFSIPAKTTQIEAVVGLSDAAYLNPSPTDGVDVLIFERLPDGSDHVLFQRNLDPLHRPADRGPQTIALTLDHTPHGPLVFGIYPGPAHDSTCDWAYWQRITLH